MKGKKRGVGGEERRWMLCVEGGRDLFGQRGWTGVKREGGREGGREGKL